MREKKPICKDKCQEKDRQERAPVQKPVLEVFEVDNDEFKLVDPTDNKENPQLDSESEGKKITTAVSDPLKEYPLEKSTEAADPAAEKILPAPEEVENKKKWNLLKRSHNPTKNSRLPHCSSTSA